MIDSPHLPQATVLFGEPHRLPLFIRSQSHCFIIIYNVFKGRFSKDKVPNPAIRVRSTTLPYEPALLRPLLNVPLSLGSRPSKFYLSIQ